MRPDWVSLIFIIRYIVTKETLFSVFLSLYYTEILKKSTNRRELIMKNVKIVSKDVEKIYQGGLKSYEDPADYIKLSSIKAVKLG